MFCYRLATDMMVKSSYEFNGMVDIIQKTIRTDGIRGIYRGFTVSCVGGFLFHGVQIGLFTTLKPILTDKNSVIRNTILATNSTYLLPGFVSTFSLLVSYPLNTIRCRMMLSSGSVNRQYGSALECGMKIIRNEGFSALIKGALTNVIFIFTTSTVGSFLLLGLGAASFRMEK